MRSYPRAVWAARGDNLDITWLKEASDPEDGLETSEEIAAAIEGHLTTALDEVRALIEELSGEADDVELAEAAE